MSDMRIAFLHAVLWPIMESMKMQIRAYSKNDIEQMIAIWNEIDSDPGLQLRKKLTNSSKYVVICGFLGLAKNNIFISKNTHKLTNLQLAECLPIQDDKPIKIESAERLISNSLNGDTHNALKLNIKKALKKILK